MESRMLKMGMLLTAMTISAVLLVMTAGNSMREQKEIHVEKAAAAAEKPPVEFTLKAYQGKLYLLPEEDRKRIEEGISAGSEEELRKFLEDWD